MLNLKPKYLEMVKKILALYVPHKIVWAYGSRVNGTAHDGSDLDLVIIDLKNEKTQLENLIELRKAFSESNIPISVDILDWATIPESFRVEIKRNYEIIQSPYDSMHII